MTCLGPCADFPSGKDASRSPRRSPPRGPRGEEPYRDRDWDRRGPSRGRAYHPDSGPGYGDNRYRRRESPGYTREGPSPEGRGYGRDYHGRTDSRERGRRSPGEHSSPGASADEAYHRDGGYRSGPGRPHHTIKMDDIPDHVTTQGVFAAVSCPPVRACY